MQKLVNFSTSGDPPDPEIELRSPELQADSLLSELPREPIQHQFYKCFSVVIAFFFKLQMDVSLQRESNEVLLPKQFWKRN